MMQGLMVGTLLMELPPLGQARAEAALGLRVKMQIHKAAMVGTV